MEKTISYAFRDAPTDCKIDKAMRSTEQKEGTELGNEGVLGAFLQQECVNKQLADALLKHPTAVVNTLLEWWAQYLASPEYSRQFAALRRSTMLMLTL